VRARAQGTGEAVRRAMAALDATLNTKKWGQQVLDALKNI
jgi:hypothetical protein